MKTLGILPGGWQIQRGTAHAHFGSRKIKVVKGKGNQEVGLRKPDGIFKETSHMELGPRWEVRTSSWKLEDASAPACPSKPSWQRWLEPLSDATKLHTSRPHRHPLSSPAAESSLEFCS